MHAEDVARFLQDHPSFFEEYADLLSHIYIPHPHGGRAISIGERQILTLRDGKKAVEVRLAELLQFGEGNDAISEKVHRLALAMLCTDSLRDTLDSAYRHLREDFAVPHVTIRLWGLDAAREPGAEFDQVQTATREMADGLAHPYCGPGAGLEASTWFSAAQGAGEIRSIAIVRLAASSGFGMLVMASEDAQRFFQGMGTLYLARIGELLSAAVLRTA